MAYGAYWALVLNHYETTDNAYVQGNLVQLTPQVGGTVIAINADDTDHVKAGQLLVKLDPADAQVALDQAEAQLGQTVREVRTTFANNSTLKAQIALREADVAKAQSDLIRAQDDVSRRQPLLATGAVGKEEFNHAQAQVAAAKSSLVATQSAVVAAREQLASNQTLTEGVSVDQHPNVLRAAARVREAYLALHRADLLSPVDGYVAKRSVQLGQRVPAGAPLMSVIALNQVWVEANFKESQLKNLRIGQPVTLEATCTARRSNTAARSKASARAPARRSRCCRRRTLLATGSRWCSACRCASSSIRRNSPSIRCASACRWTPRWTSTTPTARCSRMPRGRRRSRRPMSLR